MAKAVTGVEDVLFWREIVVEKGRPRLFHRHGIRDTSIEELKHAHVLVGPPSGPYMPRRYWAEPVAPDRYRLHCLKDFACVADDTVYPGEQLQSRLEEVYLAKPFEHGNVAHLHY